MRITEGPIVKPLVYFFFPILFGTFFQQLYNTVDALIVGNFLGKNALAAVGGTTGTYVNLYVGFFVGLASATTVLISQYYGSENYRDVSKTVHTSFALSIIVGAILTVLGIVTSRIALIALGVPDSIIDMAVTYTNIYFMGLIPLLIYNVGCSILRAVGDSKHPLYYLIVASVVNTVLDILFIASFNMGVAGAAIATVIAEAVSAILVVLSLIKSDDALHLNLKEIKVDLKITKDIVKIGLPAGLQSVLYSISNLVINSAINSFDVDAIAAFTAFGKIDQLYWQTVGSFGSAITTFTGQNFGARKYDRVKKGINRWLIIAIVTSLSISGVCMLFAGDFIGIFNDDPAVIAIGISFIFTIGPLWSLYTPIEIIAGGLRGCGNTIVPTIITATGIVGVRLLWVLVIARGTTLSNIMLAYPISWGLTSLIFIIYYYIYYAPKILKVVNA